MPIAANLLENYQKLLSYSQQMLRLASQGQWNDLVKIEISYAKTVEALARHSQNSSSTMKSMESLRPVLRHLLDNERELKQLLAERKAELYRLINQSNRQKSLMSTYASNCGLVMVPRDVQSD